jgi:rubrerythrin
MSYTQPDGQPQGISRQFTNKLREILIAELIAINGYQSHIENSNIEEINGVWHSIMLDEKKHYGWILALLRKYDPDQYAQFLEFKNANPGARQPIKTYSEPGNQMILNNIREDIKGELEAVILYEEELPLLPHNDIRKVLSSIIIEEKGHSEHLTRLLLKYDPDIYDSLD